MRPAIDQAGPEVVLRRQPVRIVNGQPEGGYTSMIEIICCDCDVPPGLQRIRGPYPIAAGWLPSRELIHESLPAFGPSASPTNRTPVHPRYGDR
jgi:hypothetical protein